MHLGGVAAVGADGRLDLLALGVEDVTEDDLGTLAREELSLCGALAPRAAADQCDLAVELSHGYLPVSALARAPQRAQRAGAGCVAAQCFAMSRRRVNHTPLCLVM